MVNTLKINSGEVRQRRANDEPTGSNDDLVEANKLVVPIIINQNNNHCNMIKYFIVIFLFVGLVCICGYFGIQYYYSYRINVVRKPINLDKVVFPKESQKHLFWGTYRPQLYFGLKHRSPVSLLAGLMWFTQYQLLGDPKIRYWCNDGDKLKSFNWKIHDSRNVAQQVIYDTDQTLTTSLIKRDNHWMTRINVTADFSVTTSLMWYVYLPEDSFGFIAPVIDNGNLMALHGKSVVLGDFKISYNYHLNSEKKKKHHASYLISHVPKEDRILATVRKGIGLKGSRLLYGLSGIERFENHTDNIWVFELTSEGNFTLDVTYESSDTPLNPVDRFTSESFQQHFDRYASIFHKDFKSIFRIENGETYSRKQVELAKSAFSNLIGGIAYFYGSSIVHSEWSPPEDQPQIYWPASLFTGTPARSQFPRGFLWDEGFHNLLISRWDPYLSFDIIGHWLDLMNAEGWIPREQILGWEARAKVPDEFVIQQNKNGNPPTLVLALEDLDERFDTLNPQIQLDYKTFLAKSIPRLEAWFHWFNTTQLGEGFGIYQWKGRSLSNTKHLNPLTLTSGLDDYPRASHPSHDERHLDLRCWMAMFSRVMAKLRSRINLNPERFLKWNEFLQDENLLNEAHWDFDNQRYSDYGLHSEAVSLIRPPPLQSQHPQNNAQPDKMRHVSKSPKLSFIPHFGYVNLFPLLMKILSPSSEKLNKILTDLEDPRLLWTKYGLRSLALNSSFYKQHNSEHDPPYWRGTIWINVNYLAIRALAHYSRLPGPYQKKAGDLYLQLRSNVVTNVLGQMKETGYLWEQYDDISGRGLRAHPFSGWTSLVVMAMADI